MRRLSGDEWLVLGAVTTVIVGLSVWLLLGLSTARAGCGRMSCWQSECDYSFECGSGCYCLHDNGRLAPGVCLHRND